MHLADDPDDFVEAVRAVADVDPAADRVLVGEMPRGERLVDDRDHRRLFGVAIGKRAAAEQRDAERREVVGTDVVIT